ncbi:SDR family NAD(P)-dependent oxidoreductase [Pararhodobacter zhoushanensis]|uniref:SDR family NAD(P)-dependent oxidoreductase n=1 Tax=Pararhodobacter zhoushanensis TaxID=2479545 RepID=UPI000F8E6EA2|nr:SDR family oxidoreductase [Pararhodobacter zhoushanensis]
MTELSNKIALVTGASRGLGRAIATTLAEAGASVVLVDLKDAWAQTAAEGITATGGTAIGIGADVSDRAAMQRAVARCVEAFGGLDILVNNAMWNRYEPIEQIEPDVLSRMVGVGMAGIVWGLQAAVPAMRARGGGSVVNIGSMAGRIASANTLLYSGVKAAVDGMTRAASVELGPHGIRVNAVAPSTIATDAVRAMLDAETFAARKASTPLGRIGTEEDIAQAVLWLASERAGFVTGQSLAVDGGMGHAFNR